MPEIGAFSGPHEVEFAPDGDVWVADANRDRMVRPDDELEITRVLEGSAYNCNGPRYQDFGAHGRMYVADKYSHGIKVIAPDGALIQVLGTGRQGNGGRGFQPSEGVEIWGDTIWLSDTRNARIVRYRFTDRSRPE